MNNRQTALKTYEDDTEIIFSHTEIYMKACSSLMDYIKNLCN